MKTYLAALMLLAGSTPTLASVIEPAVALIDLSEEDRELLNEGSLLPDDILKEGTSEVTLLPRPLAQTVEEAEKPPGYWDDAQKLSLETFK